MQNYLLLLSCLVVSIIAIHFCLVLLTLTSQGFTVCTESTGPPGDKVSSIYSQYLPLLRSLHWLPVRFRILFKINLLTYKNPAWKTACLSSLHACRIDFVPVHWDQTTIIVCQSLGSRPILVQELFTLVPGLFGTTCRCLSVQPFQLLTLRNIWRHISLIWLFPP